MATERERMGVMDGPTDPFGNPRFFRPGTHPAAARERAFLAKLEGLLADVLRMRDEMAPYPLFADRPLADEEARLREAIDWHKERLAHFEAAHSEEKARWRGRDDA